MPVSTSLSESVALVVNPCPKLTEAELYESCGLMPPVNAERRQAFAVGFQYSAGSDADETTIEPGEERQYPQSLVKMILRDSGHRGLVAVYGREVAEKDRLGQIIRGLDAVKRFYQQNGTMRLAKIRRNQGWTDKEMEELKFRFAGYYLNQRKYELICEREKELQAAYRKASGGETPSRPRTPADPQPQTAGSA